ncbi:MAG: hypothetical protein FJY85_25240, partial [Deltaproteobacteria bacterium]|nr:hypothetical protein [Deltaproteobacteria bacterium]
MPRLEDFLAGQMRGVAPIDWVPAPLRRQYRVIRAEQRSKLLESVGQRVTVIGRILHTPSRATGRPYVFLSFGDTTQGCFTLVIWSEGLQLFEAQKKNPSDYKGKWVSVTGLLARYDPADRPPHPQIVVQMPSEIEVLAGGEEEARERLRTRPGQQPATRPPSTSRTFSDPYRYWTVPVAQAGARSGASKPSIPAGQRTTLVHPPSQRPQLTVSETSIDLGEVQSARTEEAMIGVSNSGTGLLRATVTKVPPWLSVSPKQLTCAPGTTQWITISLQSTVAPTQSIRSDAITIQSNGGSAFISVRVQVVAPVLQIDTKRVRISLDREGAGRAIVKVTNSG